MAALTSLALGAAAAGTVASVVGAEKQASAAAKAGQAQENEAQKQLRLAQESQQQAIQAAESPQQLAALEKQLKSQEKGLAREEQFLSSIDPTLVEASQQALKLLRGEESSSVNPVRQQRERQRKQLLDQLREQLGPGAETSSAGMQALQNFDFQTSQAISGAQQSSLGQLLQSTQQSGQLGRSSLANLGQLGLGISSGFGDVAQRGVSAVLGGQSAITAAGQGAVSSAGGRFAGDAVRGGALSGIGGSLIKGGIAGGAGQGLSNAIGGIKNAFSSGPAAANQAGGNFTLGSNIA